MKTTDPQDELLDIVDANDCIVGAASRQEVHARGLRHRACHMLVLNRSGEIYLQKRSATKDNNPGLWDTSAAGHVDSGESYLDCAVRELGEELGLKVAAQALQKEFKLEAEPATGMEFAWVYSVITDQELQPDPVEIAAAKWVEPSVLTQWIEDSPAQLTEVFRSIWSRYTSRG